MNEHPLSTMMKLDPELVEFLQGADRLVYTDGALPKKFKLLMAMAFDAAHGAVNGVKALALQAKDAGASDEEIAEALRVAWHLSGVGSVYCASNALKDLI